MNKRSQSGDARLLIIGVIVLLIVLAGSIFFMRKSKVKEPSGTAPVMEEQVSTTSETATVAPQNQASMEQIDSQLNSLEMDSGDLSKTDQPIDVMGE